MREQILASIVPRAAIILWVTANGSRIKSGMTLKSMTDLCERTQKALFHRPIRVPQL